MELMQANHQWSTRPPDERFCSLDEMFDYTQEQMANSKAVVVPSRSIKFEPAEDNKGLVAVGPTQSFAPTHWAFNQACNLVGAPADYMRSLPSPLVADNLNYGYQYGRDISDVGMLLYKNGGPATLKAVTGPNYGRIWNAETVKAVRDLFGHDSGWHIPYEFNKQATVTKDNTTLYAGDRDCWMFLCDGTSDVELPGRRNGQSGRFQRGFFVWNSDVGSKSLGLGTFLFDYMCCNHIIWGVSGFEEIRIRHTVSAPDKWLQEIMPALDDYAKSSTEGIKEALLTAKAKRLEKVDEFLANRFGPRMVGKLKAVHELEEQRPIETVFDVVTAATAVAKGIPFIGPRVDLEREAGLLLRAA